MSSGLLDHSFFGLAKRYIHKNKYVLEVEYDLFKTQYWSSRYHQFLYTYLTNKSIKFVLFPDQIYIRKCNENSILKDTTKDVEKRVIIYDHFVLTLGEEIRHRIEYKQQFSMPQLWYFLGCLVNGASELAEIHTRFNNDQELIINPDSILLNQFGLIKMLGYYTSPQQLVHSKCFQTPTAEGGPGLKRHVLSATFSVGRVMASLVLLKDLSCFEKDGMFDKVNFDAQLLKHRQRIGILYNIIIGMMQGIPQQRILLHQISALLFPYSQCILNLEGFRLDRGLCRESMIKVLAKQS